MSQFKVEVVKVAEVLDHPGADRLDIIKIEGMAYTVVSGKGNYKTGDLAFYFPIDSVIPQEYVEMFGIGPYYSKKLRAAKLRGIFSEGLLIPVMSVPDLVQTMVGHAHSEEDFFQVGYDFTEYFEVTKYEYPLPSSFGGDAEAPIGQYKFPSPESFKRYPDLFEGGEEVVVTEKLHGTNFTIVKDKEGIIHIGSHNYFWKDNEANQGNVYVRAYHQYKEAFDNLPTDSQIWGEIIGVQDLKYGLSNGKIDVRLFAARSCMSMLDYEGLVNIQEMYNLPLLSPLLYRGPYYEGLMDKWNDKDSSLHSGTMMEGVCITPIVERTDMRVGRVCLKRISDRYHLRKNGSELH